MTERIRERMNDSKRRTLGRWTSCAAAVVALGAPAGCIIHREAPPAAAPAPTDLTSAVHAVVVDLAGQLGPGAGRTLVIDPLLDGRTGQQTHGSERAEEQIGQAIPSAMTSVKLLPFDETSASQSQLLLTGTLTAGASMGDYRLVVALSDRRTGIVVAQAVAPFHDGSLDATPTRFYADSPSLLVRDRSVEGYIKTADTPAGKAADPLYIDQLPTSALLADALTAYNAAKWDDSLSLYEQAVKRPDGQQLRTFNGIYLNDVQLGHATEAEEAFGKIAALGLATNNLAVKLLFRPATAEFWPDPKISAVYPMWLRQIARAAQAAGSCLNIVGHTSPTGSPEKNLVLSTLRATAIRERIEQEAPGVARRSRITGVGSSENLVGTGADDASDALDRRVEFKVVACAE